jgi:hypothetical protein
MQLEPNHKNENRSKGCNKIKSLQNTAKFAQNTASGLYGGWILSSKKWLSICCSENLVICGPSLSLRRLHYQIVSTTGNPVIL